MFAAYRWICVILQPWTMNVATFFLDLYKSIMTSIWASPTRRQASAGHWPCLENPPASALMPHVAPVAVHKKRRCRVSQRGGEGSSIELWSSNNWSRPYLQFSISLVSKRSRLDSKWNGKMVENGWSNLVLCQNVQDLDLTCPRTSPNMNLRLVQGGEVKIAR